MEGLTVITGWFAENEAVLSGLVAFVALVGLLLSPFGGSIKALLFKAKQKPEPGLLTESKIRAAGKPTIYLAPFTGSSEEAKNFAQELSEEVRRTIANLTGSILVTEPTLAEYTANITVLLTGSRSRATLRLQDCHSNEDFWSGRFEADLDDRLEAIDQLSAKLSTSIRYEVARRFINRDDNSFEVKLTRMGFAMVSSDPAAWDEGLATASELLAEQPKDSMFHCIYGGLLLRELALSYGPVPAHNLEKAQGALQKALTLNDRSDFAHAMMGRYLLYCQRDYRGAKRSYMRSLELNPLYAFGLMGLGYIEIFSGDARKGIELSNKASASSDIYKKSGQLIQAVAAGELKLGNFDTAVEWIQQELAPEDDYTGTLVVLAAAAGLAGNKKVAEDTVASLKEKHPEISIAGLRRWPYKDDADWELFVSGLIKAGLN
ncbi:MAG: hypothetical protein KBT63_09380 [Porticoccaceae bacterium]|nr:hypothetical protein [Porticoccaceae bacterium]